MKLVKYLGVVTLCSTFLLGATTVTHADVVGNYDTKAKVTFTPNTDPTNPVDPENPGEEVDPEDPVDPGTPIDPGTNGPLSLDYASNLNFGTHAISAKEDLDGNYYKYSAANQKVTNKETGEVNTVPLYAQVTDNRGNGKGWNLKVKQNGQLKAAADSTSELTGAEIHYSDTEVNSISTSGEPTVPTSMVLSEEAQTAMKAVPNTGEGTWVATYGDKTTMEVEVNNSVQLWVPKSTNPKQDSYSTTITWSLEDSPGEVLN